MLRCFARTADQLTFVDSAESSALNIIWYDLLNPAPGEDKIIEHAIGAEIPTRDEMKEIEPSARLYHEDGAHYMTITTLAAAENDEPIKAPITFILKGQTLATVRYSEPRSFSTFCARTQKPGGFLNTNGESVMLGLLEAIIDRTADILENIGDSIDGISREVFRKKTTNVTKKTRDLQTLIERIGIKGDVVSAARESLVSISRLVAYYTANDVTGKAPHKDTKMRLKLIARDAASLSEHASFMSDKFTFLLDATLGLINLEQNQIIKIFSVAAVVFLPPTLVASIYGMNYEIMPELKWTYGYPFALGLMVLSAIMPYLYFKRRGWL